jgi:hypothetical protein
MVHMYQFIILLLRKMFSITSVLKYTFFEREQSKCMLLFTK